MIEMTEMEAKYTDAYEMAMKIIIKHKDELRDIDLNMVDDTLELTLRAGKDIKDDVVRVGTSVAIQ
jgi:hypothetical protein